MKAKKFDSVKMMREIRENLSKEFSRLSAEEKIKLLNEEFPEIKIRRRLKLPMTSSRAS